MDLVLATENNKIDGHMKVISLYKTKKELLCCKYSADYTLILAGSSNGTLEVFKPRGEFVCSIADSDLANTTCPVTCIEKKLAMGQKNVLCSYSNGMIKSWNLEDHKCKYTVKESRQIYGVSYSPVVNTFLSYGSDGVVLLYDAETRAVKNTFSQGDTPVMDGHASRVFASCFHPQNKDEFCTGGWDGTVQFWDARTSHSVRHISPVHICGEGVKVSPNGLQILTCAWQMENPMQLWDYGSAKLIENIRPDVHHSQLYCGLYLNEDFAACGGMDHHLMRVVDMRSYSTMGVIKGLQSAVYSMDCGPMKTRRPGKAKTPLDDLADLQKLIFVCGKRVFELKFGV